MQSKTQEHLLHATAVSSSSSPTALVQRKCACGGSAGFGNSCSSCRSVELATPKSESLGLSGNRVENNGFSQGPKDGFGGKATQANPASGHDFGRMNVEPSRAAGKMSMHVSSVVLPSRSNLSEVSDEDPNEQTASSGSTTGNRIDITFDPSTSAPRPHCDRIIQTQWIQMTADGSPILPGTYRSPWTCRDATCLADATYLDHGSCSYTTPYPVDRGIGTAGSSNGTVTNATYFDAPTASGGDRGFNTPANPTGWQTLTYLFGNYAFCAAGTDCGIWYDGIEWNYTKTAADAAAGRAGVATGTASVAPPRPGARIIRAFDQYNSVKGFSPCTSSSAGP